jgi:hypothetical protein
MSESIREKESEISPPTARTTRQSPVLSYISLFGSLGTLICCALPSILVVLGLGATVASFLSVAPLLVTLSRHKVWVFSASGLLIGVNFLYVYVLAPRLQAHAEACPREAPERCETASRMSKVMLWLSAALYLIGFFSAFVLGPLLFRLASSES